MGAISKSPGLYTAHTDLCTEGELLVRALGSIQLMLKKAAPFNVLKQSNLKVKYANGTER